MKRIESADQITRLLGQKFGKSRGETQVILEKPEVITVQVVSRKKHNVEVFLDKSKETGQFVVSERHTFGTEDGISKGSYMSDQQTLDLQNEVRLGEESKRTTDGFNRDMGIAD